MKILGILILSLVFTFNTFGDVCNDSYVDLRDKVTAMGWKVTSEMGGGHNAHSRHYVGKAIDISVRGRNDFHIAMLYTVLQPMGYIIRDERTRPPRQRVWGGPHIHIGIPYCDANPYIGR